MGYYKDKTLSKVITIRLSEADYNLLVELAKEEDRTMTNMTRVFLKRCLDGVRKEREGV